MRGLDVRSWPLADVLPLGALNGKTAARGGVLHALVAPTLPPLVEAPPGAARRSCPLSGILNVPGRRLPCARRARAQARRCPAASLHVARCTRACPHSARRASGSRRRAIALPR